jgi:MFS family permease
MEYWKKAAIINGIGTWSDTMDVSIILMTIPLLMQEWGIGPALMGIVSALGRIGVFFHCALSGPLIDRFGRKKIWVLGNFLSGVAYVIMAMSPDMWIYALGRALNTMCFNMSTVASLFVLEETPTDKRGFVFGLSRVLSVFGSLNVTLGLPLLVVGLGWGWRGLVLYNSIFNFAIALVGAICLRESSVWVQRRKLIAEGKLPPEEAKRVPFRVLLRPDVKKIFIAVCWLAFFCGWGFVPDWYLTMYQGTVLKWDPSTYGYIGTIAVLVAAIGPPLFGRIADKKGRLFSLGLSTIVAFIGTALFFQTDLFVGIGVTPIVLLYGIPTYLIWRTGFSAMSTMMSVWQSEVFPLSIRATGQTFAYTFRGIVDMVGMTVAGFLAEAIPMGRAITLCAFSVIIAVALPIYLKLETKGKDMAK